MIKEYNILLNRDDESHPVLKETGAYSYEADTLCNPEKFVKMSNEVFDLKDMAEEYVYLAVMDSALKPLGIFNISHGTACEAEVRPREIFIRILLCGGTCFVLVHNHPSGDPKPSEPDIRVCKKIKKAAELMEVKFADFIIIGKDDFTSFARENIM